MDQKTSFYNKSDIFALFITFLFIINASSQMTIAADTPEFLRQDYSDIVYDSKAILYNGNMELGIENRAMPGYSMRLYFNSKNIDKDLNKVYVPLSKKEKNGNHYLEVPAHEGLVEYNLETPHFRFKKDTEVEFSFRAKEIAPKNGEISGQTTIDFRCKNKAVEHGTVNQKYPVLFARRFELTNDWKSYKWKIKVKGGETLDYVMAFRVTCLDPKGKLASICVDDLTVRNVGKSEENDFMEASFIPEKKLTAYTPGESAKYQMKALLPSGSETETVKVYFRTDTENAIVQAKEVVLKKEKEQAGVAGKKVYVGNVDFKLDKFGSFNIIASWKDKPLPALGGNAVSLHDISGKTSQMQRKIGANYRQDGYYKMTPSNESCFHLDHGGIERDAIVFAASGFRHAYYSLSFKAVQPQIDKLDFSMTDMELPILKKYDIEPVACIGSGTYHQNRHVQKGVTIWAAHPDWFGECKRTYINENKQEVRYLPSDETWTFLINGLSKHYGKEITKWMIFREPQWAMTAKDLFGYQKIAYEIFKRDNPEAKILGCNATSDAGNKLTGWVEQMEKLGASKYQDYLSFHPYQSGMDYQNGVRFRFSKLVEKLREIMPGQPLWNTELFFIPNTKRKQYEGAQQEFTAGDVQRHYLLGLLNDLVGVSAINAPASLYKDYLDPNEIVAGLNTVSYFLKDKDSHVPVKATNNLIRAGIFAGENDNNCSGVLWALQPAGMKLIPAKNINSVTLYDTFGNKIVWNKVSPLKLGLDPMFITGSLKDLKEFFEKSNYSMDKPLELRARSFGENQTFYEAQNLMGSDGIINLKFTNGNSPVKVIFNNSAYQSFEHSGKAAESYQSTLAGDKEVHTENTLIIKNSGEYTISKGQQNALKLQTTDGSTIELWTENEMLNITADVIDKDVTAAKTNKIYEGDVLEVFIDRTPFNRLDLNEQESATGLVQTLQYAFSPKPTATGETQSAMATTTMSTLDNSKATAKSEITGKGYQMSVQIPLSEISPTGNANIIGMYFEIGRVDSGKKLPKALLHAGSKPSYKYRLHYPLFKIKDMSTNQLTNGDVENGQYNWITTKNNDSMLTNPTDTAYDGKQAIRSGLKQLPDWGRELRRGIISYNLKSVKQGTYKLSFYARAKDVTLLKVDIKDAEPEKSPLSIKDKQLVLNKGNLPDDQSWTKYEFTFNFPKDSNDSKILISFLALRASKDAYALVDNCSLQIIPNN